MGGESSAHQSSLAYSELDVEDDQKRVRYRVRLASGDLFKALELDSDRPATDDEIREISEQLAQSVRPVWGDRGRRSQERVPFPRLVECNALEDDGMTLNGDRFYVVGKNLAPLGFDFFHQAPIPNRYAIVTMPLGQHLITFQIKISWCRFLKPGWYDSGGRFVKVLDRRREM